MRRPAKLQLLFVCSTLIACGDSERRISAPVVTDPAVQRIVTLSPHLAELVFAVGAGELLAGVSAYTDYPAAAADLPVIGDAFNVDQERLTLLEPDLLLAWDSGTPAHVVDDLRTRGFRIEVIATAGLVDVPLALRQIGRLTGHEQDADRVASVFEHDVEMLAANALGTSSISVFYQVDARPLYTINGDHYVSELISLCGGNNIFADLDGLAPLVSVEAVLERDPEVIMASSDAGPDAFVEWDRWTDLAANRYQNRFLMPANEIGRATPRLLVAAGAVCKALASSRENREARMND